MQRHSCGLRDAAPPQPPANQPTNQPTNKQTNQPTNQPTNKQTNQPTNQQTNQPTSPTAAAEKAIERIKAEGLIEKPFVPKRRAFAFPPVEKMGQTVCSISDMSHGYGGRMLFKNASLEIERGDRVAIIGPNG